jgi:hypothetical protein
MLRTLDACHGLTSENGDVPPDILPMAIWFDSVEDLSNGLGYVSEDAYDNPLGKLRFHGARVDRATRAEWEAWRQQAAEDYVERGALSGPWGYDYPDNMNPNNPDIGRYVSTCQGYQRLKLPDLLRERMRSLWPSDQPRFWTVPNEDEGKIRNVISDPRPTSPPGEGRWANRFGNPSNSVSSGLPIRSGRYVESPPHMATRWPAETYPFLWPPLVSAQPITTISPSSTIDVYVQKLEFREGALNGFAACQNRKDGSGLSLDVADPAWRSKRHVFMVDDQVVRDKYTRVFMLQPAFVVERDESVFIRFTAGL